MSPKPPGSYLLDKQKRLSGRRKAVTMAVGFACKDGIVIGADRQVTGRNYTFPECKLDSIKWANGHGIYAYSGDHDTYKVSQKEVWTRFVAPSTNLSHEDVERTLKECLQASLGAKESFFTLFGYWIEGMFPTLLMSIGTKRVTIVKECEVIGYGDSPLARHLLGRFRDVPHYVTVHQARIYAVSFIAEAKKYDGQYVGGGTDVFSVDKSGDSGNRCVRILDAGQTGEWEKQIGLVNYWWDVLFSKLTDKDNRVAAEQFDERIKQFRAWAVPNEPQEKEDWLKDV